MKKFIALVLISLTGCSLFKSSVCDIGKKVVDSSSVVISTALVCKNQSAIKDDLEKLIVKVGVCKSAINQFTDLCDLIANGAVDLALSHGIPSSWGCSGGVGADILKSTVANACRKIIP